MTADRASDASIPATGTVSEVLLDGLITGMIGAVAVALWFLGLDLAAGRPLYTPSLLGNVLMSGSAVAAGNVAIEPVPVAAYTAFHFVVFIAVGLVLSYLMSLFERFPIMFFVLLVLFLSLQVGFFFLDLALGAQLMGMLKTWTVVVANLLAAGLMALYQWKRHPSVMRGIEKLWEDN